jgi:hypothetical protein
MSYGWEQGSHRRLIEYNPDCAKRKPQRKNWKYFFKLETITTLFSMRKYHFTIKNL